MKALHLVIQGRVQGVGFRDWLVHEASQLGLSGWVRNRELNRVEAIISGPAEAVDLCVQRCRQGPALAIVSHIDISEASPPREPGFTRRISVSS